MTKNHLKSLASPKSWPIKRKKTVYITRPKSSGQKMEFTLTINMVLQNMLNYCKTKKEVKNVLAENEIRIDGKRVKDPDDTIGFMGVLTIKSTKENYRVLIDKKGKLTLKNIDQKEADLKPSVVWNKTTLGKNKIQLNLSDGSNILIKKNDYKTGDMLLVGLEKKEIKNHIKFEKGSIVLLIGGKHIGTTGVVEEIGQKKIIFKDDEKNIHETDKKYAFVLGAKKPLITI